MAQHISSSAAYRDLPIAKIVRMSEAEAYELCRQSRWHQSQGEPVCPRCGADAWTLGNHDDPSDKRQFRCKQKGCRYKFTITSGTLLHSRKLDFQRIIIAVKMFSMTAKGLSAILLGNETDVANKTAFVLCHKLREAQIKAQLGRQLSGIVEIDGSEYGGYYHQVNERSERIDRRKAGNITGKKMALVVARERSTPERVGLSTCTVVPHESDARPFIFDTVDRMAKVYADDGSHWDALRAGLDVDQVNHSQRYYDKGICTNQAESYFSRVARMEIGTHHHIAGPYLWGYGCDAVWREDHRKETQGEKFHNLLRALLSNTVSRTMKGYWQRHLEMLDAEPHLIEDAIAGGYDMDADILGLDMASKDADAIAVAGSMDRADVLKAFGPDVAEALFGPEPDARKPKRKMRAPFAPKRPSVRPEPWSELKRPDGLPSMRP